MRWNETGADASALAFTWDIFELAGQPSVTDARKPSANVVDTTTFAENDIVRNATAFSQWPISGARPRSAAVVVRRTDGGVIGA